ncbi:Uncharacterized iron-regulated membrane protein [Catalinimonas alkaloidigena]|uniref:Uncharacterized iron-regulated membrane protein n=1 Tax=Catalinimonas alkaloidigena TaxID=1075417 RepID=A0A1G9IQJ5_9BACT|nr:PepSY-associated TM helix domain-containing protein [Catalinimonas alkaloidigena]SDL27286.1 Uncharacterized iron-regulated membrane protein [Catalinimonas alkaloidigena]
MASPSPSFNLRKLFNDLHLWLGIASGLVLFLVCLSGTVYTFRSEIEEALASEKYRINVPAEAVRLSPETILRQLQQTQAGVVGAITVPADPARPYEVSVKTSPEERHGTTFLINPYTGTVQGTTESAAADFFMFMFRMHRWLLMEQSVGRVIVGVSTLIFVSLILTGLVLWWPKKRKQWKQGFTVKTSGNWKRINHDLHNTLGFYAFGLLLVMALTGLCWSFEWYRDGLSNVLGAKVFGGRGGKPTQVAPHPEMTALPASAFLTLADEQLPYEGDTQLSLPNDPETAVTVRKHRVGFFALAASDKLEFDPYTGEVLKQEIFADKPLNEQIAGLIRPLHTGEVYGTFSKILYFLACLIGTSLPVTGTIIWINKLKKKVKRQKSAARQPQPVR